MTVGEVGSASSKRLFVEDNLYTIVDEKGEQELTVEHWFGQLESLAAPFIRQLLQVVRHDMTPVLDPLSWDLWHIYNYHAHKRTVNWHRRSVSRDDLLTVMRQLATEKAWTEQFRVWESNLEEALREMNNARIASQMESIPSALLERYRILGMAIYVAPPRTAFILGDEVSADAVIEPGAGRAQFMPIAPDVAVGYSSAPGVHVTHMEAWHVRRMNEAMAKQSVLLAGRSRAQIASLSRISYAPQPSVVDDWSNTGESYPLTNAVWWSAGRSCHAPRVCS